MVIVGVMRLTGTSCCLWEAAGLDDAGVRGFGGACMIHPSGPSGLGLVLVLEGGEVGVGSVDRGEGVLGVSYDGIRQVSGHMCW